MRVLIPILILGFMIISSSGCVLSKSGKKPVAEIVTSSSDAFSEHRSDEVRLAILRSFITAAESLRGLTANLHLHVNEHPEYRDSLDKLSSIVFDQLLFKTNEFSSIKKNPTPEQRDMLIKAYLLIVQIRIDIDAPNAEGETTQNRLAKRDIAILSDLAGERNDLDIRSLKLDCPTVDKCLSHFKFVIDERG